MTQVLVPFVLLSLRNGTEEVKIHNEKRREKIFKTSVAPCSRSTSAVHSSGSPVTNADLLHRVYMEK